MGRLPASRCWDVYNATAIIRSHAKAEIWRAPTPHQHKRKCERREKDMAGRVSLCIGTNIMMNYLFIFFKSIHLFMKLFYFILVEGAKAIHWSIDTASEGLTCYILNLNEFLLNANTKKRGGECDTKLSCKAYGLSFFHYYHADGVTCLPIAC